MKFLLYMFVFFGTVVGARYGLGWPTGVGVACGLLVSAAVFILSIPISCVAKPEPYQCWHELRNDLMPESNVPVERILERCGGTPPPNATVCKGWKRDERRAAVWLVGRMLGSNSMEWFAVVNMWASQGRTSPPSEPESRRASVKDVMAFAAGMMEDWLMCNHGCYTISCCLHNGTDMRYCVQCRVEFVGPCEPENYFHE